MMTNDELANLITARMESLRGYIDLRLSALIDQRLNSPGDRSDLKVSAAQNQLHKHLLTVERDVLDLRLEFSRLREAVNSQASERSDRR